VAARGARAAVGDAGDRVYPRRVGRCQRALILYEIWGPPRPKPKPKVVTSNSEVVRDAIVKVGPDDPNYAKSDEGVVRVKRADFVTIRMDLWEEQQRQKREDRLHRRMIDPDRLGHWGPVDED
jgi:hypothetical protein